jgi:Fe-S cluster assembly ATP-binding protein
MFLAFQYPHTVEGLPVGTFLKAAVEARRGEAVPVRVFKKELDEVMTNLGIGKEFLGRSLNDGFSGGEKKRNEILQLLLLNPDLAILDETDSGLDVDALKAVFGTVRSWASGKNALLVITHYDRVLDYIQPTHVHIMKEGKIVRSGGAELSKRIDAEGFEAVLADTEEKG